MTHHAHRRLRLTATDKITRLRTRHYNGGPCGWDNMAAPLKLNEARMSGAQTGIIEPVVVSCPYGNELGEAKKGRGEALRNRLECGVRRLAMAHRFTVIFEKEAEGGYHVFCPTLPGCHTQSETIEEGVENIREAIGLYIESLVEDGLPIPTEDIFIKPIEIPA